MDFAHVFSVAFANVLIAAARTEADRLEQLIVPGVDQARLQQVDVLVVDVEQEFVALRIGGAIGVGPELARDFGEFGVRRQEVVAVGERR